MVRLTKCHYPFKIHRKKPHIAKVTHFKHSIGVIMKLVSQSGYASQIYTEVLQSLAMSEAIC